MRGACRVRASSAAGKLLSRGSQVSQFVQDVLRIRMDVLGHEGKELTVGLVLVFENIGSGLCEIPATVLVHDLECKAQHVARY